MKLYLQLVRLFLGAGIAFGCAMCLFMTISTNWYAGLTYGFASGALFAFGVPVILMIAGRNRRRLAKS